MFEISHNYFLLPVGGAARGAACGAPDTPVPARAAPGRATPPDAHAEGGDPTEPRGPRAAVPAAKGEGLPGSPGEGGGEIGTGQGSITLNWL